MNKIKEYLRLTRFDKPAGLLLLLWPTLWGVWLAAEGYPGEKWLFIFIVGVIVMRAFGCAVNDMIDYRLDRQVARTQHRPLATGAISHQEAAAVALLMLCIAFILWWQLPVIARGWAAAALLITVLYPLGKKIIPIPQAILGVAFSFGIIIAYAAIRNAPPPPEAWGFVIANWCWVMSYDTIYAMCDRDDDIRHNAKSSAIWFGDNDVMLISIFYVIAIVLLSVLGLWIWPAAIAYQVALIAAMVLVFRFWRLYRSRQPAACQLAFKINHWWGAFVWAGIVSAFI